MKTIFLVDEDVNVLEQNKTILETLGYRVEVAYSAKEATSLVGKIRPDLVISDVLMDGPEAGFVLTRYIRENFRDIPVIILSGDSMNESWLAQPLPTIQQVSRFLDRPVLPEYLGRTVKEVLAR